MLSLHFQLRPYPSSELADLGVGYDHRLTVPQHYEGTLDDAGGELRVNINIFSSDLTFAKALHFVSDKTR
mgnify:CR=1 FL=1